MKVLVVGSGGREHALCWALKRGASVSRLFCAPGNAGIAEVAECVPLGATDVRGLAEFAEREGVGLTVVGGEAALAAGLADEFEGRGLRVAGPRQSAARLAARYPQAGSAPSHPTAQRAPLQWRVRTGPATDVVS